MHTGPQTWVIKPVTAVDSGPNGPKSMAILGIQPAARAGCVEECHAKIGQNRPSALGLKSGKNSDYGFKNGCLALASKMLTLIRDIWIQK
ncbi:hypothetical protein Y032_0005g2487 [Ancylostoma ceylanicum]|uniref:Uncharacterized protein n=1 Tax=Ancylostoma ceylanicum TaxID=53326 RepID=A0A016VRX5_9BILA|nr:hypothetical protein Y032_0005g2487 [Ancylostoma ceylanicum]